MFGVKEIIKKIKKQKNLTNEEKYAFIRSQLDYNVLNYLAEKFNALTIKLWGVYEENILDLMAKEKLEGFCWQTTEVAIVFLNDEDFIERGYLKLNEQGNLYYHSWICFMYNGILYVFDPCLNLLCKKEIYDKMFLPKVKGKTTSKEVKEHLIYCIQNPKQKELSVAEKSIAAFFMAKCPEAYMEIQKETLIDGKEDINFPIYRSSIGCIAEIDEGQIRKLTAHYYKGGFI